MKKYIKWILLILFIIAVAFLSIFIPTTSSIKGELSFNTLNSYQKQTYWQSMKSCQQMLLNKQYTQYRTCALDALKNANQTQASSSFCTDTDGINYLTKGKVTSDLYPNGIEDYTQTFSNGKTYVMEGACTSDNKYVVYQKNCEELGNSYIAADGACAIDDIKQFLNDPIIGNAIGNLNTEDTDFLRKSYNELQEKNTAQWSEFDNQKDFTLEQVKTIWLRRVAHALYVEKNKLVPWSLKQFSADQLKSMLSFCDDWPNNKDHTNWKCELYITPTWVKNKYQFQGDTISAPNPITEFNIAKQLLNPPKINVIIDEPIPTISTPKNLIDGLIIGLRKIGLNHIGNNAPAQYSGDKTVLIQDFYQHTLNHPDQPIGGSQRNAILLSDLLRSWNVPSLYTGTNKTFGHGSILFPSENIGMYSADDIQGLNDWPVDVAYYSISDLDTIFYKEICQSNALEEKLYYNKILNHYKDPLLFYKIYYQGLHGKLNDAYCINPNLVATLNSTEIGECSEEAKINNPIFYSGQFVKPYSDSEVQDWTNKISSYAKDNNLCGGLDTLSLPLQNSTTFDLNISTPTVANVILSLTCEDSADINGANGQELYDIPKSKSKTNEYILNLDDAAKQIGLWYKKEIYTCQKATISAAFQNSKGKYSGGSSSKEFPLTLKIN